MSTAKHIITDADLINFVETTEVTFASSYGKVNKRLNVTLSSDPAKHKFKIYKESEVMLATDSYFDAVQKFNEL